MDSQSNCVVEWKRDRGRFVPAAVIFGLSPVDNPNKPLDDKEKKRYKLYTRIVLAVELAAWLISIFLFDYRFNLMITYVIFVNAVLVFMGYIAKK